jgi:4-hydroxybenzoate polyprenyltransferase
METVAAAGTEASRRPLAARLWAYQRERFPLAGFLPLITAFTFSSAAYSRLARGAEDFIPWSRFAVGALTAVVFFFMLRVLDEHKDADLDRRYRPELPVPRGLVTLGELRAVGVTALAVVVSLNALVLPVLLVPMAIVAAWAALMTREFFVRDWLRAHPTAYLLTHMAIMPLIDVYTTGLDWLAAERRAPDALTLFLGVTFLNGMLIEIGRKVRTPAAEREGVDSYTRAWGLRAAPAVWLVLLSGAAFLAVLALGHARGGALELATIGIAGAWAAAAALRFLRRPDPATQAGVERASQHWMFATYLALGTLPFIVRSLRP